jgi:hypothetical protein
MERKVIQSHGRYAKNHSADTYRLYNPVTKHIVVNRDVTWLDWNRLKQEIFRYLRLSQISSERNYDEEMQLMIEYYV